MAITRIVIATDGSETAQAAMAWTANLAHALGAAVVAVHALDLNRYYPVVMAAPTYVPIDFAELTAKAERDLTTVWVQPLRDAGVKFRTRVEEGRAAAVILDVAAAEAADLIVMGSRGHGGFTELLMGSVAHQVTHHATTPVVVIPPAAAMASRGTARAEPSFTAV